ncbi:MULTISPECIES: hypothetical protein [Elizabethkingia]|nr:MULTISPECIES: hypothetical protein [Elizabethkingia]MCL1676745.1 hypothetical protein [Elizabethkingia meningoseptica]MCL1686650.1 hypothetical protein [Elizabethkingia meningoseptica]MDX8575150.1 hypothetical protein [Elizabethkingia sp. HX WYD]MEC4710495.1 hypothetical protein [Elizabethkingia meningoseptica]WBS76292.1 hypothetical protein PF438_07350 [Elizabethkingia meningoseptica]
MKKRILLVMIGIASVCYGQSASDNVAVSGDKFYTLGGRRPSTKEVVIDGDPYVNGKDYLPVSISGYSKNVQHLRYNAYEDEMEFNKDNVNYYSDRLNDVIINFPTLNKKYEALHYILDEKAKYGYLVVLAEGPKYSLFKKETVELMKGEKGSNAFVKDANDYYAKAKDVYLLKKGNQFFKLSKNGKDVLKLVDNKPEIEGFIKSNKINFSKESDLIKFINFVNQ